MNSPALLHLMHLVSPALPVGAYAYSQGLEYAIDQQWLKSQDNVQQWIEGLLLHGLANLDIPVLFRLMQAWDEGDECAIIEWNDFVRASRETKELLLEDEQLGMALQRLLVELNLEQACAPFLDSKPCFVVMFSLACVHWHIPKSEACFGFAFSWLENQVAAATKLLPLGQTAAQKLLISIMPKIDQACEKSRSLDDEQIGLSLPGLAMASSLHESQYSRLFRS